MPTTCQVLGEPSRWGFCEVVVGLFPLRKKVFLATAGLLLFTLSLFFSSSILFFSPIALTPSLDLTLVNLFPGRQAQTGKEEMRARDLYLSLTLDLDTFGKGGCSTMFRRSFEHDTRRAVRRSGREELLQHLLLPPHLPP